MLWTKEAKDTIWLIGLQGVNYLVPLFVWPYLMVALGAEQFGVYSFGIALAQYLMMLVDFGFNLTASKQIALAQGDELETNRIFSATMTAKLLLLCLSGIIVAIVSVIPAYIVYRNIVWITWLMVVGNAFSMFWLFQGLGKIKLISIVNTAMKLLILPLVFVFVKTPADANIAAWIQAAVFVGSGIVIVWLTKKLSLAQVVPIQWKDIKEQLKSSFSIFLSSAATSTYTALFVVILAYMVSADEVGRYSAAEKIMRSICYLIWMPISQAYFPRASKLGKENPIEGKRLMRHLTLFIIVALGFAGIAIAIAAEPLVNLLGKDYTGIGTIAAILSVVPVLIGIGGIQGQMGLIAMGGEREKKAFRNVYLMAGVIALVSVCILSYIWGAVGAAIALVLAEGFVCVSMCIIEQRRWRTIWHS
ncbi:MAG: flippase [Paludibacteraceae bacterium]|nr:flippase [Paludibacteraceae bacterium]